MKRDEEREPDTENDQGDKEVAVSEDGSGLTGDFHRRTVDFRIIVWRQRKNDGGESR
jgi:hypothetical protein